MDTIKVYSCKDTLFYNSQCLFIEYHDVLKSPWLMLLGVIKDNEDLNRVFDMSEIKDLDGGSLVEWYLTRKNRNFFMDFPLHVNPDDRPDNDFYDNLLFKLLSSNNSFYECDTKLNFYDVLKNVYDRKMLIKKIKIYSEFYDANIEKELESEFNNSVEYCYGNFSDVAKTIPDDTTFVFSDINKINILATENKLNYQSILIVNKLRYNYDNEGNPKADLNLLSEKFTFKYNFFENF